MAIEYNYDGPPSLEIYQEFVRTSATGADAQSVVIVAEHYDVVKTDYNPDRIKAKPYIMGTSLIFDWASDLNTSEDLVDKDSIKAVMSKVYTQKKLISGTYTEDNGNQLKVSDANGLNDVYVGDIVAIPESTGKNVLAKIISIESSDSTKAPSVAAVGSAKTEDAKKFVITGTYTGKSDRIYYIQVLSTSATSITAKITTADGTDGMNSCVIPVSSDGKEPAYLADSGLKIHVTDSNIDKEEYFSVTAVAGHGTRDLINLDIIVNATAGTAFSDIPVGSVSEDLTISTDDVIVSNAVEIPEYVKDSSGHIIMSGEVFLEYRAISNKFRNKLGTVSSDINLSSVVGYTGIENPMGVMASVAFKSGATLYVTSVNADTAAEYQRAFSFLSRSTDTYAIVIGSLRADVIANLSTFVSACADPKVANYKIGYYGLDASNENIIWEGSLATVIDGKAVCEQGGFLTKGVRAGDIISIVVGRTASGNPEYKDFTVADLISDTTVRVEGAPLVTIPVPSVFMVKRELAGPELIDALKNRVYNNNHRCYCVFGDGINIDGIEDAPAWLLAALPAGMRAAEYVQRPISNLAYDGCTAVNKLNLSAAEMRDLASRGVWILANDTTGSVVYNYHQLSTDMSDKKHQEQSYTTNFDNISRSLRALLSPYYGNSNISSGLFKQITADIVSLLNLKAMKAPSVNIGPQLIGYSGLRLEQDPVNKDHVYMYVDYEMPAPFNHVVAKQRLI